MGLDMYAQADGNEIAYWRKHNRLHGWMEELWLSKGKPYDGKLEDNPLGDFNCVELELSLEDIEDLAVDIENQALPETGGFFFGSDSYTWNKDGESNYDILEEYYHLETDLNFIKEARKALNKGQRVTYSAWF
tara:strand:+ start:41 stop:439 length:399 start_codon:yes stop_codon:yes gene_type:complete